MEYIVVDCTDAGKVIKQEIKKHGCKVLLVRSNQQAIQALDTHIDTLRCVIIDPFLLHNSTFEFLYEMRSYADMSKLKVIAYSSRNLPKSLTSSLDWKLLDIKKVFYKSNDSVATVCRQALQALKAEV